MYLDRYSLEEFTIEKKLFSMWETNQLNFVESFEVHSSLWYANLSIDKALAYLSEYESFLSNFSGRIDIGSLNSFTSLIQTKKKSVEEGKAWVRSMEKNII